MTAPSLSLTKSQTLQALGQVLTQLLPTGVEIVVAQDNRVPEPEADDFVTMSQPVVGKRLATNVVTYGDPLSATGQRQDLMAREVTVQVDVHGPNADDNAAVIQTLVRSSYGVALFKATGFDVAPLYTSEPRQLPFKNEAQQIESRVSIDIVMQCNPVTTVGQDFATRTAVGVISVEATYPVTNRLTIRGTQLIGPNGQPITLRGWNWGRWGTAQPQDAHDAVAQGANIIRMPLRWWGLYQDNVSNIDSRDDTATQTSRINPNNLLFLDAYMEWAKQAGLMVILFIDSNCGQSGLQSGEPQYCDPAGDYPNGRNFWTSPDDRAKFIYVWRFIAKRYRDHPSFVIAEPLPEPNPQGVPLVAITQFYDQVMDAIREEAPGVLFLVGPRSYTIANASDAYNKAWTDVIYTGDLFLFPNAQPDPITNLTTRLQGLLDLRDQKNAPILVQQCGCQTADDPTLVYTNAMLSLLNSNNVPWTWWQYRDGNSANGYGPWYQNNAGAWILKPRLLDAVTGYFKLPRMRIEGSNILLPDGTPWFPSGTNSRWELAQDKDAAYTINTVGLPVMRVEIPWWQNGSAGDARDDNSPGNINPTYLAQLDAKVAAITGAGMWVQLAWHSKCGRSGLDSSDPSVAVYCSLPDDPSAWPNGRNVWTDLDSRRKLIEAEVFIANRYKNVPRMGPTEPLNEPDPQGITAAEVSLFYAEAMDAVKAVDPNAIFVIGGTGGYDPSKAALAYIPKRYDYIITIDWFDFFQLPTIAARQASLTTRLNQLLNVRETFNVPVLIQQFGTHYGADTDRSLLAWMVTQATQENVPWIQWEERAPTVGPVAGDATYGWVWDRGDGVDTIRIPDQTILQAGAAAMNAKRGVYLQAGQ